MNKVKNKTPFLFYSAKKLVFFTLAFISISQNSIANLYESSNSLSNDKLNIAIKSISEKILSHSLKESELSEEKQKLDLAIANLTEEIKDIDYDLKNRKKELIYKLRYLYKTSGSDFLRNLFESKNAGQLERNLRFLTQLANNDFVLIQSFNKKTIDLDSKREMLTQRFSKINALEKQLKQEELAFKNELEFKNKILDKIKRTQRVQEHQWNNLYLQAVKSGDTKKADYYSFLLGKSFMDHRGNLPWPTDGNIIQKFGILRDTIYRLHLPFNGVFIESKLKAPIKTVAQGEVVYIDQSSPDSSTVLIHHGHEFYTLYGSLTHIQVKLGEKVIEGQTLGLTSPKPFLAALKTGVYFEIREGTLAKDPLKWLTPKEINKTQHENWENIQ